MKKITAHNTAVWTAESNITGTLALPFINYLCNEGISNLPLPYMLTLINIGPILLGTTKSARWTPPEIATDNQPLSTAQFILFSAGMQAINSANACLNNELLMTLCLGGNIIACASTLLLLPKAYTSASSLLSKAGAMIFKALDNSPSKDPLTETLIPEQAQMA